MPPGVRGKGKGPMRGGPSSHAGPSHRRTPSASFSTSDSNDDWRQSLQPMRRSVSLSTSPSYHPSFGPPIQDEPQHSHHSHHSHHSLHSHSFHHSDSHHSYSPGQFNPNDYINEPPGYNSLGPEDHFSQDMDMDSDPDPTMPPTGTPTHPIRISSGSSYAGSPYQGPDSWDERWNTYKWEYTPSFHNSPPQPPMEEPHFQAVTPSPLPVEEPPQQPLQPPPEPPRRRRNARMSVRGGPRFSSRQATST
ncbi:protein hunchback-like [Helianthus annuus]|uniref:protein hunchback-like n=1 Tax=Helianthus annuus TaxID=4232 RepID=UPI000B9047A4|nr:protein hunchback-like [Helianthus annuus]